MADIIQRLAWGFLRLGLTFSIVVAGVLFALGVHEARDDIDDATADLDLILEAGDWELSARYDGSGALDWCEAVVWNRDGQSFDITIFEDRATTLYIYSPDWSMPDKDVDLSLFLGGESWPLQGYTDEDRVIVPLPDDPTLAGLFAALSQAPDLAIRTDAGHVVARFDIGRARDVLEGLVECAKDIKTYDPFRAARQTF